MSRRIAVTGLQVCPVPWEPSATLEKLVDEARSILSTARHTDMLVFPEYYLNAFGPPTRSGPADYDVASLAEPIPGPTTERLGALAEELGVWLLPGSFLERAPDGAVYNTAVVFSPAGELRARYRKMFPWRPMEPASVVRGGCEFVTFDVDGVGRAGLLICYDTYFPEVPRQLAWLGAEVLFHVAATSTQERAQEIVLAQAAAIANQVYVVSLNASAPSANGRSVIVDPEGRILQLADEGEGFLTEVLDLEQVDKTREHGLLGVDSRMWDQLDEEGAAIHLPQYGGVFRPRPSRVTAG